MVGNGLQGQCRTPTLCAVLGLPTLPGFNIKLVATNDIQRWSREQDHDISEQATRRPLPCPHRSTTEKPDRYKPCNFAGPGGCVNAHGGRPPFFATALLIRRITVIQNLVCWQIFVAISMTALLLTVRVAEGLLDS